MTTLLLVLYVLHLLLIVLAYRVLVFRLPEQERGILTFICLFSAVLPLLGELLGGLAYLISRRFASSDTLLDYDEYVQFDVMNLEGLQQQAADNMEMVPIKEALNMDAKRRKQSMIHLTTSSLKETGKYLQYGLDHDDSETVHYAATVRNSLFDRYEANLRLREQQLNPIDVTTYHLFIQECRTFLESGLLDEGGIHRLDDRLDAVLEQMRAFYPTDLTRIEAEAELALRHGKNEKAIASYEEMIHIHPTLPDGYLALIRYYFRRNDWTSIGPVLRQLRTEVAVEDILEEHRFILERLEGGDQ
ncbi:hypothetical protein ADM98_15945 [Exiguobacterium sp. BMC-KP]|uniref:hypothetical protein n=1 Tax=Exiguobacterium sp. BMC-KP TaxID=1684312 RepID=UPI0006AA577E|nr:hypothetical protein [Exiguobacterium sp. BMC-KP]KOP30324.1 hypothetical protein ADM98_15945 [Exiguobacterium sp. BMC-KP]